jgi:hypothetical protein
VKIVCYKSYIAKQAKEQKKIGRGASPSPSRPLPHNSEINCFPRFIILTSSLKNLPQELRAIPARVTIEAKALAKTHTPTSLLMKNLVNHRER